MVPGSRALSIRCEFSLGEVRRSYACLRRGFDFARTVRLSKNSVLKNILYYSLKMCIYIKKTYNASISCFLIGQTFILFIGYTNWVYHLNLLPRTKKLVQLHKRRILTIIRVIIVSSAKANSCMRSPTIGSEAV